MLAALHIFPAADSLFQKKALVWGLQNWLQEAEARKRHYLEQGPSGPATWILSEGGQVPKGALPAGQHNGETLYVCRGFHEVCTFLAYH